MPFQRADHLRAVVFCNPFSTSSRFRDGKFATTTLRAEGRWAEASKFKDSAMSEFKLKGMKRTEASEAAWEAMEKAYPPLATAEVMADSGVPEALAKEAGPIP